MNLKRVRELIQEEKIDLELSLPHALAEARKDGLTTEDLIEAVMAGSLWGANLVTGREFEIEVPLRRVEDEVISQTISYYRIIKKLGAGGMGELYLAEDTKLDRKVAVKLLPTESIADGKAKSRLLRGPRINVPEYAGQTKSPVGETTINEWSERGWLDLRPANIERWQERFRRMLLSAQTIHRQGSAAITMEAYRSEEIRIGEVAGWL